jgi:hypothetical protein
MELWIFYVYIDNGRWENISSQKENLQFQKDIYKEPIISHKLQPRWLGLGIENGTVRFKPAGPWPFTRSTSHMVQIKVVQNLKISTPFIVGPRAEPTG